MGLFFSIKESKRKRSKAARPNQCSRLRETRLREHAETTGATAAKAGHRAATTTHSGGPTIIPTTSARGDDAKTRGDQPWTRRPGDVSIGSSPSAAAEAYSGGGGCKKDTVAMKKQSIVGGDQG